MSETILLAEGNTVTTMPRTEWEAELRGAPESIGKRLEFMTADHHRVRRFAVAELPRRGKAITVDDIATALSLPRVRVAEIIEELERALFFVVRTQGAAVSWAFPVTVDPTPHPLIFSSGEHCYAA